MPSYLGTSASFVGGVLAIRAAQDSDSLVTGSILVAGLVLAAVGLAIKFLGIAIIHKIFPPAVTGGVVMLIGFGLAFVVADVYWPQDRWVALITMFALFLMTVVLRGFWSPHRDPARAGLRLPAVLAAGQDGRRHHLLQPGAGEVGTHAYRVSFDSACDARGSASPTSTRRTSSSRRSCWCCQP